MNRNKQGLVIDCSFIMSILLPDESSARSQLILESGRYIPWVPFLWTIEVGNVLLSAVRRKRISVEVQNLLLVNIEDLAFKFDTHPCDLKDLVDLATQYSLTAYDAVYLELALRTGLPLATLDNELKRAALEAGVAVV